MGNIQALYRLTRVRRTGLTVSRGVDSSPQGFPRALASVGGEEVRGPTSWAVPTDGMGTVFVEAVKAPLVPGVQKPPHRVGKRFQHRPVAVPMKEKAKKPAGLKTRHVGD